MSTVGAQIVDRVSAYDDDIYAWSREQASALRRLAETRRDLPNELDLRNVAEEIEDVGRSELRTVESFVELMLRHLLKLASAPEAQAARHWEAEVRLQHRALRKDFRRSMAQLFDLDEAWATAVAKADAELDAHGDALLPGLPPRCPFDIDELMAPDLDVPAALEKVSRASRTS